jgi:hypothetical protein
MTSIFDRHPAFGGGSGVMLQDQVTWDARKGRFYCFDPTVRPSDGSPAGRRYLDLGLHWALDIGHHLAGAIAFKPRVLEVKVPYGAPPPALPPGTETYEWQMAEWMQVLIEGIGRRRMRITGTGFLNVITGLIQYWGFIKEVQEGKIPSGISHEPTPFSTDYGDYFAPVWETTEYLDRDVDVLGPRIVPPPPPFISGGPSAQSLPPPANDPVPEPVKLPEPKAAEPEVKVAQPETSASTDPLERYRPSGRKPF